MSYKLEDVSGIGKATAERLKAANIDSVEKLANTTIKELLKLDIKGVGKTTAEKYIKNAREMLKESEVQLEVPEKLKEQIKEESKSKPQPKPISKEKVKSLKDLIKRQAECNIGLVGHVDHGIF